MSYGNDQPKEMSEKQKLQKTSKKIIGIIKKAEEYYKKNIAREDARNLSYWRGKFWEGDGYAVLSDLENYNAQQNEIFPIIDTITSSLALDLPQCEVLDVRQRTYDIPDRYEDSTFVGRRIASVLNWMAERDNLDETTREATLHAMLFSIGAVRKITWSMEKGQVIWRMKMPWEVQFDPSARRLTDISWASERFILHESVLRERIENGSYVLQNGKAIKPDTFPRSLIADYMNDGYDDKQYEQEMLKEYVTLHEYWDFRKRLLYHVHTGTDQILMVTELPYGNPYDQLVFHDGVGRLRGIPDVSLLAPLQQDINELVSARREIVRRLPKRMFYDKAMFPNEEDAARFMNSQTWEPVPVETDGQNLVGDMVYVTPDMPTTFDFNRHLDQATINIKNIAGMADYQRGQVKNIRTAAEANMVQASVQGRMQVRTRVLTKFVKRGFDKALEVLRWAITNTETSGVDMEMITRQTQMDVSSDVISREIIENSPQFRILPFSPLMEDKIVRREQLVALLGQISATPSNDEVNWREITKEIIDMFSVRPSILKDDLEVEDEAVAAGEAALAQQLQFPPQ
mgnify:FL=1|tara:strand:- start:33345 stop:35060 length:1716 start_codon:yes stop_codon:yes gene_type:complete